MGLDLEIMYSRIEGSLQRITGHSAVLRFAQDYELFGRITKLPQYDAPEGWVLGRYTDDGYTEGPAVDAYSKPLKFVVARDWHQIKPRATEDPLNRAILHFVTELPPDARIWLYWC